MRLENETVATLTMVNRLFGKAGMVLRARAMQHFAEGKSLKGVPDDQLIERLHEHVDTRNWVDAAILTLVLWRRDWRHHLGRDFLIEGDEPEHVKEAMGF